MSDKDKESSSKSETGTGGAGKIAEAVLTGGTMPMVEEASKAVNSDSDSEEESDSEDA